MSRVRARISIELPRDPQDPQNPAPGRPVRSGTGQDRTRDCSSGSGDGTRGRGRSGPVPPGPGTRDPGPDQTGPGTRDRRISMPGTGESLCCRRCCCIEILRSGPVRSRVPGPGPDPGPGARDRTGPGTRDQRISTQQRLQHRDSPFPGPGSRVRARTRKPGPDRTTPGTRGQRKNSMLQTLLLHRNSPVRSGPAPGPGPGPGPGTQDRTGPGTRDRRISMPGTRESLCCRRCWCIEIPRSGPVRSRDPGPENLYAADAAAA